MVLTEGLGRWSCSAGERTAMSRGGAGTKQAVRAVQGSSGPLVARIDARRRCEAGRGVSGVRKSPTA